MALTTEDDKQSSANINIPLDVVAKEVKQDDRLCRQVCYTLLSMYTKNPINLAINAPTGEGKSYPVKKVAELFPEKYRVHRADGGQERFTLFCIRCNSSFRI